MKNFSQQTPPSLTLLSSQRWRDYELLDSGNGLKLERFGAYTFVRPEAQCMWKPALPASTWKNAHATFRPNNEESGGHWEFHKRVPEAWTMEYELVTRHTLRFRVMTTPGRHLGVFPEMAAHWDWFANIINEEKRPIKVLNLFGYTGLASLAASAAGAQVTHLDASKKSVNWASENRALSGLDERSVRWIVDDALKFVEREARRGAQYDGILLDPPKFGRGPKGEVWEVYKSLPALFAACRAILSREPLFLAATLYAVRASAVHVHQTLQELMPPGKLDSGELVTLDANGRALSQAVYARWQK
jgi:23S rRNA (cytosine1962-C5)-methyltransferase